MPGFAEDDCLFSPKEIHYLGVYRDYVMTMFLFWWFLKQIQVLYLANGGIYQQHFGALGADIPFEAIFTGWFLHVHIHFREKQ